ncbi:transcription factor HHO1 isoform X2 [Capsella rubella]|uniref:transcription factor HHO1 isoform X2 n=1 Tax=Capsella rubella TaxID=81985 RepID=UPI000CD59885|nr:transcription factor HHO1 isoform X2 [Capsella rubella]
MIKNLSNIKNHNHKREYIEALEVERRKINVFQRELPLCLELVTRAIEAYKREISGTTTENLYGQSECSEQTTGECGRVLDLFIPLRHSSTSVEEVDDKDVDDDEDDHQHDSHVTETDIDFSDKNMKSDWLKSVQLWNQSDAVVSKRQECSQDNTKSQVEVLNKNGGEERKNNNTKLPENTRNGDHGRGQRKNRRCWSQELHRRFLNALKQLGGPHATPKQIRELMKVDGLTNDEVKSHLQKYRLHARRPSQTTPNNRDSQTQHFVVVGGIWVPQTNHSTGNTIVASAKTTPGIYGPMVSPLPSEWPSHSSFSRMSSEDRSRCSNKGSLRCSSSAMSSSTRTKTKDAKIS